MISQAMDIEESSIVPSQEFTEQELIENLSKIIGYLLDRDLEKLMNILYRIDVSEQKVKEIFAHEEPGNLSMAIAELIVERQKQKIYYRNKFRNQ